MNPWTWVDEASGLPLYYLILNAFLSPDANSAGQAKILNIAVMSCVLYLFAILSILGPML